LCASRFPCFFSKFNLTLRSQTSVFVGASRVPIRAARLFYASPCFSTRVSIRIYRQQRHGPPKAGSPFTHGDARTRKRRATSCLLLNENTHTHTHTHTRASHQLLCFNISASPEKRKKTGMIFSRGPHVHTPAIDTTPASPTTPRLLPPHRTARKDERAYFIHTPSSPFLPARLLE
jgi:hypothetical protein